MTYDFHKIHSVFFERRVFLMFFKIFNMLNFDPKQAGWLSFKKLVWIILFISLTMFLKQGKIEQKSINVFLILFFQASLFRAILILNKAFQNYDSYCRL